MPTPTVDSIERKITIRASKERVFKAIVDPTEIVKWFPNTIEGTIEKGATPVLDFGDGHRNQILVVAVEPHDYVAYRWVPCSAGGEKGFQGDVLSVPNTLVEFRLTEGSDGTTVTVKESGFASLPPELAHQSFLDNADGWNFMFDRLEKLFASE